MTTAREIIERKRALMRRNRESIRTALLMAPKNVQHEYIRCRRRIRDFMRTHDWGTPAQLVIFPEQGVSGSLSESEVTWLYQLLGMPGQGWVVHQTKDLGSGQQQIIFQHTPDD